MMDASDNITNSSESQTDKGSDKGSILRQLTLLKGKRLILLHGHQPFAIVALLW